MNQMKSHVRLLAALEIAFGALGILAALGCLLLFGGIAALVGVADSSDGKLIAIPVLGAVGTVIFCIIAILSLPELIAGIGLWRERQWGRVLSIIVCALGLFNVPIGTLVGVYGLWVLLSSEGAAVFEHRTA
jgi:hypothetical protein